MKNKLEKYILLALLTTVLIGNITLNCAFYADKFKGSEDMLMRIIMTEPIFWLIPTVFLIIRQHKNREKTFSTPLLILVGITPIMRGFFVLIFERWFESQTYIPLTEILMQVLMITSHPIVNMEIQASIMLLIWIDAIAKEVKNSKSKVRGDEIED